MSATAETEFAGDNGWRRCAACRHVRRRCTRDCVLAPHFPASDPDRYAPVQRFFGGSNVARMLQRVPAQERGRAADAIAEEARQREQDPVYGCAGVIDRLQVEIGAVQCELARARAQIQMLAQQANRHRLQPAEQQQEQDQTQMPSSVDDGEIDRLLSEILDAHFL